MDDNNSVIENTATPGLYKKRQRTSKWDKIFVDIQDSSLFYTDRHNGSNRKEIKVQGSQVADCEEFPEWPYAFSITPQGSTRTYYFAAETNDMKMAVLNTICELQFTNKSKSQRTDNSSACSIQ